MQAHTSYKLRRATASFRTLSVLVAALVLSFFSLRPVSAAANPVTGKVPVPQLTWALPNFGPPAEEAYAQGIVRLRELVKQARAHKDARRQQPVGDQLAALDQLEGDVDESFSDVARHLEDHHLGRELAERQRAAVESFRQKRAEFKALSRAFATASDDAGREAALKDLDAFLTAQPGPRHKKLDVKKLPWRTAEPTRVAPATTADGFALTKGDAGASALAADSSVPMALAAASSPELSATEDVQLTPAVQELAASLGHDPVLMYNWVRNNVTYIPSFGSIQGSDLTLSKRSGNAFDTASLLIALYRASGIPARYVYGTVDVPADAAMNWVGNVASIDVAQQLLGQGGVPNARVASNGRISTLRLEHVWVEAWVDFVPSRGAKHRQGDTWVPLDASFKQYSANTGLANQLDVTADPAGAASAAFSGAVENTSEGWVQNVNMTPVTQAGADYSAAMRTAIVGADASPTGGEVFGDRTILGIDASGLAASLPYTTVAVAARYAELPSSLRHKFRYQIYGSDLDMAFGGAMLTFEAGLPQLAGKKVTLRYAPASQADADLIASYLPKPHADGSAPTATEFAAVRFPAYLIHLRPELRVDGEVRATGEVVTMGTSLHASGAFTTFDLRSGWDETTDVLTAGQATAIGLNLQGLSPGQIKQLENQLRETKALMEAGATAGMRSDLVASDLVTATIWSYFAALDNFSRSVQGKAGVVDMPGLSFGLAHADLQVYYSWGVARSAKADGVTLDVGHLRNVTWSKNNDAETWRRYNRNAGSYYSAMEHAIPEQLFVGDQSPGEAISAVKLLARAAAAGQRIYTITQANVDVALPQLNLSSATLGEIRNAVSAGKEVTVHQSPVTINGWSGAGYTVLDPATGAGGYLIEGGANGGKLLAAIGGILSGLFVGWVAAGILATFYLWFALILLLILLIIVALLIWAMWSYAKDQGNEDLFWCFTGGFSFGFGFMFGGVPDKVMKILNILFYGFVPGNAFVQCIF